MAMKTLRTVNLCVCKPKAPDCRPFPAGTTKIPLKKILTARVRQSWRTPLNLPPLPMKSSILFIEDDRDMRQLVAGSLKHAGFEVQLAEDGVKGQALAMQSIPDLIILDLMLPLVDGLTLCQRLRRDSRTSQVPILMLTALANTKDKVSGFNSGADDYLTKPFDLDELLARVKVLLRRSDHSPFSAKNTEILSFGPLTLIPERFEVIWFEKPVRLTHLEFELLHCLLQRHGQTVAPSLILKDVWGYDPDDDIETIRVHIRHLRTKLEPNPPQTHLHQDRLRGRVLPRVARRLRCG